MVGNDHDKDEMDWVNWGIASGKSSVARLIESLGHPVIDADRISHEISRRNGEAYPEIINNFGTDILNPDLEIDRKKLGQIIFQDPIQKKKLENILHPLIQQKVQKLKVKFQDEGRAIAVYDVPLLYENAMHDQFDQVILVWCPEPIQIERLMQRNHLSREEAVLRIQNQKPFIDKVQKSHFCIDNSGSEKSLINKVNLVIEAVLK